ncbi:SixA phosphatase family protein [Methylobacterium nonmethylotrophicum]|uniref:Histidine phosphatase family protein n=1 Tax=Methylobacterium nonmethylotrophicum TaxID=1141884 RepID=A0A4Z0NKU4_9HYPH|nr:histidine phosphatase family protein [Methylobacterium nonmethylotrophicum]TGD96128.1 histidine phosphatase family protein [Methylobacterium nonmethylotrophicum]
MRRLILLRHAKSDWPEGMADADRPLAPRGREAAPKMAAYLAAQALIPDRVLVSPARRTQETWDLVKPALGAVPDETVPQIYEAPVSRLLDVVRAIPDDAATALMIGHNPGVQDLARLLSKPGEARRALTRKYPTAAIAVIDLPAESWATVEAGDGVVERFVTPKSLGHGEDE